MAYSEQMALLRTASARTAPPGQLAGRQPVESDAPDSPTSPNLRASGIATQGAKEVGGSSYRQLMDGLIQTGSRIDDERADLENRLSAGEALSEVADKPSQLVPFVGATMEGLELAGLYRAARRIELGTSEQADHDLLGEWISKQQEKQRRGTTLGYDVVQILAGSVAFMGEFMVGGALARKAGMKLGAKALREKIEKMTAEGLIGKLAKRGAKIGLKAGELAAKAAVTTAIQPGRVVASTYQRALPGMRLSETDAGEFQVFTDGNLESFMSALPRGLADVMIENLSEQAGALLPGLRSFHGRVAESWIGREAGRDVGMFMKLIREGGYHGVLEEYFEERIGGAARALMLKEEKQEPEALYNAIFPDWKQVFAELTAFSIMGGAAKGADIALQAIPTQEERDKDLGKPIPKDQSGQSTEPPSSTGETSPPPGAAPPTVDTSVPVEDNKSNGQEEASEVLDVPDGAPAKGEELPDVPGVSPEVRTEPSAEEVHGAKGSSSGEPGTAGEAVPGSDGSQEDAGRVSPEVEALQEQNQDASIREVPEGDERLSSGQASVAKRIGEAGGPKVVFVEDPTGKPLGFDGVSVREGFIAVDINSPRSIKVVTHELRHNAERALGQTAAELGERAAKADPASFKLAKNQMRQGRVAAYQGQGMTKAQAEARWRSVSSDEKNEEFSSVQAEILANQIDLWATPAGRKHFTKALREDPGMVRAILDSLIEMAQKLGVKISTSTQKALKEIEKLLAQTGAPRQRVSKETAEAAQAFRDLFDQVKEASLTKAESTVSKERETPEPLAAPKSDGGPSRFSDAYHGGPHEVDEFDTQYIGTGEGAQAYGWGLYFAAKKSVAEYYKKTLGEAVVAFPDGKRYPIGDSRAIVHAIAAQNNSDYNIGDIIWDYYENNGTWSGALDDLRYHRDQERLLVPEGGSSDDLEDAEETLAVFESLMERGLATTSGKGHGYKVELAPKEEEYLLWDEPLSKQSATVRKALGGFNMDADLSALQAASPALAKRGVTGGDLYGRLQYRERDGAINSGRIAGTTMEGSQKATSLALLASGIRGVKYLDGTSRRKGEGSYNYVIFDGKDVEITDRFSTSSPKNSPDVAERKTLLTEEAWEAAETPDLTKLEKFRRRAQDLLLPIQRYEERVQSLGGNTDASPRTEAANMPGKIEARNIEMDRAWKEIQDIMRKAKFWGEDSDEAIHLAGEYLYAVAAPEVNALLRLRSADEGGGIDDGSGMTDAEAKEISERLGELEGMKEIADIYRETVIEKTRDQMLSGSIISQAQLDYWRKTQPNYAPLRSADTDAEMGSYGGPRSQGFQVSGPIVHKRKGRKTRAENPLVFGFTQASSYNNRSENNRVSKALWDMVRDNQNLGKGFGYTEIEPPEDPSEWEPKNAFGVWVNGEHKTIRLKDANVNRAMKNLGYAPVNKVLRAVGFVTRFMGQVVTTFNPNFMVPNSVRDLQTALVNISPEKQKGVRGAGVRGIPAAMRAIADAGFRDKVTDSDMGRFYNEVYVPEGGLIGWSRDTTFEQRFTDMKKDLRRGVAARTFLGFLNTIHATNSVIEMATRVSFAKALVDAGVPKKRAIRAARELTVDFNRRGEMTSGMSIYKMFINARIQGTAQMLININRNKKGMAQIGAGIAAFGFGMTMMNLMSMGDDDDGVPRYLKKASWKREKNIMFPNPLSENPDEMFMIPLTYGYNIFYVLGAQAAEAAFRSHRGEDASEMIGQATEAAIKTVWDGFSPISDGTILQALSPTALVPFVQTWENTNWNGMPIMPTGNPFDKSPPPDSERYFASASLLTQRVAKQLNSWFGGNKYRAGTFFGLDASVSPETMEHLYESYLGGLAKMGENFAKLATQPWEDTGWDKVPVIRRFYSGDSSVWADRATFYESREEVYRADKEVRGGIKVNDRRRSYAALIGIAKSTDKQLGAIRKLDKATDDADKKRRNLARQEVLYKKFNTAFNKARIQRRN